MNVIAKVTQKYYLMLMLAMIMTSVCRWAVSLKVKEKVRLVRTVWTHKNVLFVRGTALTLPTCCMPDISFNKLYVVQQY